MTSVPAPTYIASSFQADAFNRLNLIRSSVGLGLLAQSTDLDTAAQNHSKYMQVNGLADNIHRETAGRPNFSGVTAGERISQTNFGQLGGWAEVIGFEGSGRDSVDGLVAAIYHRFALFLFKPKQVGIGFLQPSTDPDPKFNTYNQVVNLAYSGTGQGAPSLTSVVWPADNSTTTSTSMPNELPRPGIPGASGVFGYPVSISADEDRTLTVTSFVLTDNTGAAVVCNLLSYLPVGPIPADPELIALNARAFAALVPRDPLKPKETYTVQFVGTLDGAAYSRTWSFKTP